MNIGKLTVFSVKRHLVQHSANDLLERSELALQTLRLLLHYIMEFQSADCASLIIELRISSSKSVLEYLVQRSA